MPGRTLIHPASDVVPTPHRAGGPALLSVALHSVVAVAVGLVQLSGMVGVPGVARPIEAFALGAPLPAPPSVPAPSPREETPAVMRDVGVVPLEAPDGLQPERAVPDAGLAVARGAGRVPGLSGTPGVALEAPRDSAPAAPEAREPVRVGGVVRPPELVRYVEPRYPPVARAARVEGTVILEATVDERGRVTAVRVLRSIALLERAAIEAVSGWAYEPTLLNGVPVPVLITISVRFTID